MDKCLLYTLLKDLKTESNSHSQGFKSVFIKNEDTPSSLTQYAYGTISKGHASGFHSHQSMDEYFYFLKGRGFFYIENENFEIAPNSFVRIPANINHNLTNDNEEPLEFIYFGIAL